MAKGKQKFHVNREGKVGVCQARHGLCPYEESKHFVEKEEAESHAQDYLLKKYGVAGAPKRTQDNANKQQKSSTRTEVKKEKVGGIFRKLTPLTKEQKSNRENTRNKNNYYFKIKSISQFKFPLRDKVSSFHYHVQRADREQKILKAIGSGKPLDRFVIDDGRKRPQIHEVHSNGLVKVYDLTTHRPITLFVAKSERVKDIYERLGFECPNALYETAKENTAKKYNEL